MDEHPLDIRLNGSIHVMFSWPKRLVNVDMYQKGIFLKRVIRYTTTKMPRIFPVFTCILVSRMIHHYLCSTTGSFMWTSVSMKYFLFRTYLPMTLFQQLMTNQGISHCCPESIEHQLKVQEIYDVQGIHWLSFQKYYNISHLGPTMQNSFCITRSMSSLFEHTNTSMCLQKVRYVFTAGIPARLVNYLSRRHWMFLVIPNMSFKSTYYFVINMLNDNPELIGVMPSKMVKFVVWNIFAPSTRSWRQKQDK